MQIEYVKIYDFRNLKNFEIDLTKMKTVLIGQNASGKSNFLEAVVLIFKQLDFIDKEHKLEHLFEYEIIYTCYSKKIKITRRKDEQDRFRYKYETTDGSKDVFDQIIYTEIKKFKELRSQYLPKYIFAYYSGLGNSNRLEQHFEDHKADFARRTMNAKDNKVPKPARLLYAELIHSQLSLLSFFIDNDPKALKFLEETLGIEKFQSILLTIQQPDWSTKKRNEEDPKFFGSIGVVKNLLYYLHDKVAFAPFRDTIKPKVGLWEKKKHKTGQKAVYLYIDDFKKLREYVEENKWSGFDFFHVLNTANVSQLFLKEGIKVRVKKKYANRIPFQDLSEGEQQLLTVLGLMRFTITEEALFLLDEPDTHLNPLWRWKYMDFINQIVLDKDQNVDPSIQVIMSSHDPLTIGSLCKEEVRIFKDFKGKIEAVSPKEDPKGMGVAGVLTEIFGLETTLDKKTQQQLERRRHIESMLYNNSNKGYEFPLNEQKENIVEELKILNNQLDSLGFSRVTRDPLYQKFQAKFDAEINYRKSNFEPLSDEEKGEQDKLMEKILKELLDEEGA